MPTSTYSHINTVCRFLQSVRPNSFLDVGLGNGKIGFIARDFLDVMLGERYLKKDWQIRIDGIEVFDYYIQDHQKAIYDNIYIGDALEVIDDLGLYETVYMGDVLEHFTKEDGWSMLDKCVKHSSRYFILSAPLGENWHQPEIYGNPHEEHKSAWHAEEIEPFACEKEYLHFDNIGPYGTFLIRREDYLHHRARESADNLFEAGKKEEAINGIIEETSALPPNLATELIVVDLLLKDKRIEQAVKRLEKTALDFPKDESVKQYLKQVKNFVSGRVS